VAKPSYKEKKERKINREIFNEVLKKISLRRLFFLGKRRKTIFYKMNWNLNGGNNNYPLTCFH